MYFVSRVTVSYPISCLFFLWEIWEIGISDLGFCWFHYKSRFLPLYLWIFYLNIVSFLGDSFGWLGQTMHMSWLFVCVAKGSDGTPLSYALWTVRYWDWPSYVLVWLLPATSTFFFTSLSWLIPEFWNPIWYFMAMSLPVPFVVRQYGLLRGNKGWLSGEIEVLCLVVTLQIKIT